jgi:hypothetical protein
MNKNNLNFKIKPLIVDKQKGTVEAWNNQQEKYVIMTFEFVEGLLNTIKSKKKVAGVVYK